MAQRGRPKKNSWVKYVLIKQVHLGNIKQTVSGGTIIEHNEKDGKLRIDGSTFDTTKDLDLLKKLEWVLPYSEENKGKVDEKIAEDKKIKVPEPKNSTRSPERQKMKIINSDQDIIAAIDISDTKNKKVKVEKSDKMEIIRGDETAEERLERLRTTIPEMEVVEDD
ncbi:MAG TPA: hypothetical protein VMV86_01120, partial [Methanosarcinales archaeon]|nr:hypothetical protein [Methanosarcinales archaeon]